MVLLSHSVVFALGWYAGRNHLINKAQQAMSMSEDEFEAAHRRLRNKLYNHDTDQGD